MDIYSNYLKVKIRFNPLTKIYNTFVIQMGFSIKVLFCLFSECNTIESVIP